MFADTNNKEVAALLPAILITHSQSGIFGWLARFKSSNVKGIITFEGGYTFPAGQPKACPEPNLIRDGQQLRPIFGRNFVNAVNAKGGNAHFIWTPEIGIFGNTHFLYLDLNNVQIADLVSDFMKKTGLDKN